MSVKMKHNKPAFVLCLSIYWILSSEMFGHPPNASLEFAVFHLFTTTVDGWRNASLPLKVYRLCE